MHLPMASRAVLLVVVAALSMPAASSAPLATAAAPSCVYVDVKHQGEGLGVYPVTGMSDAVGVVVSSGAPNQGITLGILVVPSGCVKPPPSPQLVDPLQILQVIDPLPRVPALP